ncbi:MAG TPA: GDSL-type esterase/lipase family protein [Solirubrobacteraceae bacterium]|jgi:lysophospholipase L1-like esterase|nr:GDSL-type esterase/lipase family protein [Solirubrobacteraceae bacterium]
MTNGDCRLGVLAFGDSITNGGGELQWGVALQSWALWTARGLGLPYTGYAVDGARVADVVGEQIPAFEARAARQAARYDVGCLYIGVNDVQALDWDPAAFAPAFEQSLGRLAGRCERTLTMTAPLALGLPPAGPKVAQLNVIIRDVATRTGALVVELGDFGARNQVMADRVHPTAFGQIAIARRALEALAGDGLTTRVDPAALVAYRTTRWGRLRGDATFVYRDLKLRARGMAFRADHRLRGRRP